MTGQPASTAADGNHPAELEGKVAVVTGAARGIGRHIARALARAGADVVACARQRDALDAALDEIAGLGRRGVGIAVDLREPAQIDRIPEVALETFGRIDILVNNSGQGGPSSPLWEVEPEEWAETLAVNLTGAYLCSRAVLPSMIERRSGAIVFIGSVTGKRPLLHRSPYAASKLGLVGLCRTLALDAGPFGVRANVVSPGYVEGERIDWVIARQAEAQGRTPDAVRTAAASATALGRFVSADEVAAAAVFLAGERSAAITGADLTVSAGLVMD